MTDEQKKFLESIGIDPDSDEADIEERVGDYLTLQCLDENYNPNEQGLICESILDLLGNK